jgi:hypothetical protein
VGSDGGTFDYGDAVFKGSEAWHALNAPVVGVAASPDGSGFWMVAADGGVFAEGAPSHGGMGNAPPLYPVVAMAPTPSSGGYWLVTADGATFTFGDAKYLGGVNAQGITTTVTGLAATHTGRGYWMLQQDHTVYTFGDAGTMQ